jgi:hypothetical protein
VFCAKGMILHKSRLYDAALFADRKSRALMNLVKAAANEGSIEVGRFLVLAFVKSHS